MVLASSLAACSTPEPYIFNIQSINSSGDKVPCVIKVDNDYRTDTGGSYILTPANVDLDFKRGVGGLRPVEVEVVSAVNDRPPDNARESKYISDPRHIYPTDARTQLIVLRLNPNRR
jgi:hypothetical protein